MRIRDILRKKGHDVVTASAGETVLDAVERLVEHNIGAVVVVEGDEVAGILSERDVLQLTARAADALSDTTVGEIMSTDLVIGVEDDDLDYVMEIMTRNRVRHLPILRDGTLRGILSIGDVVNACRREVEAENRHLKDYIRGVSR